MQFLTMKRSFSRRPELQTLKGIDVLPLFVSPVKNASEDSIPGYQSPRGKASESSDNLWVVHCQPKIAVSKSVISDLKCRYCFFLFFFCERLAVILH